jgi:predicted house-cleaning noncanonical NTP pyrophosphatase (MazG superfamily)
MNSRQLNKLITDYYEEREQISAVIAILEAYEYDKEVFNKKLSYILLEEARGFAYEFNLENIAKALVYNIDTVLNSKGQLDLWKKSSKKRLLKAYDLAVFFNDLY